MQNSSKLIRVALQGEIPVGPLTPEDISTIALYHLHFNLWDNLLASGPFPAVAKTFKASQDNRTFTFEIDSEARFSNGRLITAADVKSSFDRIMAREKSGHINAKSIIQEIVAEDAGTLKIKLQAPTPSFLFLLTTSEFAIVPREAIDATGEITNPAVTSGAYSISSIDTKNQTVRLVRNKFFRRFATSAPDEVELSFIEAMGANSINKDFDFFEVRSSDAELIVSSAKEKGFNYKATVPSLSVYMVDTGILAPEQSRFLAREFREHFQFETPHGLEKRSDQFLPEKTFGSLTKQEIPSIPSKSIQQKLPAEIIVSNNRSTGPLVEAIQRVLSVASSKLRIIGPDSKEKPHYILTAQGMNTDFPEIELHLDTVGPYAFFNVSHEIKHLVNFATHEPDDGKRSAIIKRIGKEFLSSGKIVPLTVRAYVHLFNPSKLDLNNITTYDGDIPLYKLKVLE